MQLETVWKRELFPPAEESCGLRTQTQESSSKGENDSPRNDEILERGEKEDEEKPKEIVSGALTFQRQEKVNKRYRYIKVSKVGSVLHYERSEFEAT